MPVRAARWLVAAALAGLFPAWAPGLALAQGYLNFETVPVRPLAISVDGLRLFATNTPDNRLEIFDITPAGLLHRGAVQVGLEPVAVGVRTSGEVWVVNHLSDDVSVIDVASDPPRVVRTLLVGDEPWDVVFGGPTDPNDPMNPFKRAFVSAARRGQNHPGSPKAEIETPGIGRADVWVFDATALGSLMGGTPLAIVRLFGDKPRALASSPDGSTVYAGVFHSGNRTAPVSELAVCNGLGSATSCEIPQPFGGTGRFSPGGLPPPWANFVDLAAAVEVGLVVKFDPGSGQWRDELLRNFDDAIPFNLPDKDVFKIDANGNPPIESGFLTSVGTILFQMAQHPSNGKLYVANTQAVNEVRFEGSGGPASSVRGHLHEARISAIDLSKSQVSPRHLNSHINYSISPVPTGTKPKSLATPAGLAFSEDASKLYVAALGSSKIGILDVADIDAGTLVPDPNDHVAVTGGGPAGLVVDAANDRLYVYTRFDSAIKTINVASKLEVASTPLHSPEPTTVTNGRRFLYDASFTSSNGEASCSACHVFGDKDDLTWDLGNPRAGAVANTNPFEFNSPLIPDVFNPMKGPMTTQTLRGMDNHGPMHWRGDRTGENDPNSLDALDELASFKQFNVAFEGLLGRDEGQIPAADMQDFAEFILTLIPPPNPHRALENVLTADESVGETVYNTVTTDGIRTCNGCHALDPGQGFFGGDGESSFEGETQELKIPHLRNVYDKLGMFGDADGSVGSTGDQIRGTGLLHDGSVATVTDFLSALVFNFPGGAAQRAQVVSFVHVFPSNLAPAVGQQVTLTSTSGSDASTRINLLRARAMAPFVLKGSPGAKECDLVVKGGIGGKPRGWLMQGSGDYLDDTNATISDAALRALATPGQELTFSCVYPGGGNRVGIDRNQDGILDGKQCGDVNADGIITRGDPDLVRRRLAALIASLTAPEKCNVIGTPGGDESLCTIDDVVVLARKLAGLPPAPSQICGPA